MSKPRSCRGRCCRTQRCMSRAYRRGPFDIYPAHRVALTHFLDRDRLAVPDFVSWATLFTPWAPDSRLPGRSTLWAGIPLQQFSHLADCATTLIVLLYVLDTYFYHESKRKSVT
jgi:hypothetical protein